MILVDQDFLWLTTALVLTVVLVVLTVVVVLLRTVWQWRVVQHAVEEQDDLEGAPGRQVEGGHGLQVGGVAAPPHVTQILDRLGQSAPC